MSIIKRSNIIQLIMAAIVVVGAVALCDAMAHPDKTDRIESYIANQVQSGRDVVYLPYGDWEITRPINIPPGVREVRGRGSRIHVPPRAAWHAIYVADSDGCLLQGFTIVEQPGREEPAGGGAAIGIYNSRNVTVRDVTIEGTGGFAATNTTGLIVEGVRISDAHSWAFGIKGCTDFILRDCTAEGAYSDGFKINNGSGHGLIDGCRAIACGYSYTLTDAEGKRIGNGDGIDTYIGGHHLTINNFEARGCWGAGINIKTGPHNYRDSQPGGEVDRPSVFISVINPRVIGRTDVEDGHRFAGVMVNSTNNRDMLRSEFVSIHGGQYEDLTGPAVWASMGSHGAISGTLLCRDVEVPVEIRPESEDFHDDSRVIALTTPRLDVIAFYNFGGSGTPDVPGQNRRLIDAGSWQAWATEAASQLPPGVVRVWLHNPFGLYVKPGDDGRRMWIDQWHLAQGVLPPELTDADAFAEAMQILRDAGVNEIVAYIGSPLMLDVEDRNFDYVETLIQPLLDAGCSIAFDATYDWRAGDEIDLLIQAIRGRGHRVYVEPWLLGDRAYGEIDGVVHTDRFFPRDRIGPIPLMQPLPVGVERVVLQREYNAGDLIDLKNNGATIAVRYWTATGREVGE